MIRVVVATALICAAIPALARNKCQSGFWDEEVVHVAALQDSRWQYRRLTPKGARESCRAVLVRLTREG